jgi:peptidoglycan hydrolase CwlO-like protein
MWYNDQERSIKMLTKEEEDLMRKLKKLESFLVSVYGSLGNIKENVHFYGPSHAESDIENLQEKIEEAIHHG